MAYSTINKPSDYFNTKLYTGTGSSNSVTGVGFQPDFTWIKNRDQADEHNIYDAVRGATKRIIPNNNTAEGTQSNGLSAFGSDGFTVIDSNATNINNENYASWNWKANGAGSTNYDGSINSTVSVNQSAGFSIVTYSGNATTGATIGHGLNSVPKMIIVKSRTNGADWWGTYHHSLGNTKAVWINDNNIQQTRTYWNNTSPTSSVFTVSNERSVNGSGETFVAYCFADVTGYSKFGSYVGNGSSDGSFCYLGFKPTWVMIKSTSSGTESWFMYDNKRSESNPTNDALLANLTNTEYANSGTFTLDLLSNGFKLKNSDGSHNGHGNTYIYMAFGQSLVGSNNVPCTAR